MGCFERSFRPCRDSTPFELKTNPTAIYEKQDKAFLVAAQDRRQTQTSINTISLLHLSFLNWHKSMPPHSLRP